MKKTDVDIIKKSFDEHKKVLEKLLLESQQIEKIVNKCEDILEKGNKIMFCGNGGSAADSQHLAAEFTGRFIKKEQPLPAIALTTDTSALTAIGNDFGFDDIFSRQVSALGKDGDVLFAISTSGNSKNLIKAVNQCKKQGIYTVGFLGNNGGQLAEIVDIPLIVNSTFTARIQEMHIFIGHILCESLDNKRSY